MGAGVKPTKEQFLAYEKVRRSGRTNMFDVKRVCELSHDVLTREHCLYIYGHYLALCEEYGVRK